MALNMGRGITAPANDENIKTGAAEMQTLGSTTAFAIDDLESSINSDLAGKASTGYVDAGLAGATSYTSTVESASLARDDALAADIAGMEGMTYVGAWELGRVYRINDVVTHGGDSWARLTAGSTGEPGADPTAWGVVARRGEGGGFGELSETAVTGLYDTVPPADTTPDTGARTVTSNFPQVTRGSITVRRVGKAVYVTLLDIEFANSTPPEFFYLTGLLPVGYRPLVFTSFAALADVNGTITRRIRFQPDGQILLYGIAATSRINVTASYLTPDPWPAP